MRVEDVMTTDVATVTRDTPLKEAAQMLLDRRISGVPVVDGNAVVGVFSEADLVRLERGDLGGRQPPPRHLPLARPRPRPRRP